MLDLSYLTISRVVVYHIPSHGPNKTQAIPTGGASLVELTTDGADMVVRRMTKVLGKNSNGIQVGVTDVATGSFFQNAAQTIKTSDSQFLATSGKIATSLAKAQNNKPLSPCKLIVIEGEVTSLSRPYLAVIKAELQEALTEKTTANKTTLDHLKDIFMTESQRLYKVGFMQRTVNAPTHHNGLYDAQQHSIHLFDHLMTGTETRSAAFYFYSDFLGCDIASSAKSLTRDFFDQTLKYFDEAKFEPARRIELGEALRSEMRSNQQTLSVASFANLHLGATEIAQYSKFMEKKGFPNHAITKDTEYVKTRLKRRQKFVFTSGVMVTTPPDKVDLIKISENEDGSSTVHIQGMVQKNE
jgi:hypothetical protein